MQVALSPSTPTTLSERSSAAFHGDGNNYWFDKSISLTLHANGRFSMSVEHSWGDAPVLGHLVEHMFPSE